MITIPQEYIQIAEAFDNLAIRSEQLCALSRVIEDAAANPNKDTEATKKALWLMSSLLEEHHAALESVQKQFLRSYQPIYSGKSIKRSGQACTPRVGLP